MIGRYTFQTRYAVEDWTAGLRAPADVCIAHEFHRPPWGGGNQFCLALSDELERRGLRVRRGLGQGPARVCLFNSYNFDFARLRRKAPGFKRLVHRVDGPIGLYRGDDALLDQRISQVNAEIASATVFQSRFSLEAHEAMGLRFRDACVIPNAVDGTVFHPKGRPAYDPGRRLRIITTSWSPNPNKGGPVLKQIEKLLDWGRYQWTFVGNTQERFDHIRAAPAMPPGQLADALRRHDVYLAASRNEPCSNAVLEALACGLPVVYLKSGSHAELVKQAGLGFTTPGEAVESLEQMRTDRDRFASCISISSIAEVADRYLAVLFEGLS